RRDAGPGRHGGECAPKHAIQLPVRAAGGGGVAVRPSDALRTAAALVYPRRCPFCDRVLGWLPACPDCAGELARLRLAVPRLPTTEHLLKNLTGAAAVWRYDGCVRRAILR